MRFHRRLGRSLLLVPLLAIAGCSFVRVRPTPEADTDGKPACAPGVVPLLDLAGAGGLLLLTGIGSAYHQALCDPEPGRNCSSGPLLLQGFVAAGLLAGSAAYGLVAGSRCQAALTRDRASEALAAALRRSEPGLSQAPLPPADSSPKEQPGALAAPSR
jgi:hypothetical protein